MASPSSGPSSSMPAPVVAMRRLKRELETLERARPEMIAVQPAEENLLEWHFVLHSLPSDTPYHEGCYLGKILFPPEYPHAPPSILMVTPSGRLEIGKRLCLSMTDFHPESWNPAWSVETILVGLLSFFISDAEKGYGAISSSAERRRQFAAESHAFNASNADFTTYFPRFMSNSTSSTRSPEEPPAEKQNEVSIDVVSSELPVGEARSETVAETRSETNTSGTTTPILTTETFANSEAEMSPEELSVVVEMARGDAPIARGDVPLLSEGNIQEEVESRGTSQTADDDDDDAPAECWICRDNTGEGLIQPCACRGSMSGVHASCVEQWIRHHRRNAINDEAPRCSVCHQPYSGRNETPGVGSFARYLCVDATRQLLRTVLLVLLLVGYSIGAGASEPSKDFDWPFWPFVRVLLVLLFAAVAIHKVAVLTVSLPPHRPPPRNRLLQRFYVRDYRLLAMHIAEAFASITILLIWCIDGTLTWPYFVPFLLLCILPMTKFCVSGNPSLACVGNACLTCVRILLTPFYVAWLLIKYAWNNPRRACHFIAHPLDGGPHIIIALVTAVLCLAVASNVWIIIIWVLHSIFAGIGLIDIHFAKRWQWKEGNKWWLAIQLTAFTAYMANTLCEFPKGFGETDDGDLSTSRLVVFLVSVPWLLLVCGLGLSCNRALIIRHYRTWQHRHGTFTLDSNQDANAQGGGAANV